MNRLKWVLSRWRARRLDRRLIRQSGLFDPSYYLGKYPDVRRAGLDPLKHFLNQGRLELRAPCKNFDPAFYLQSNPDVPVSGLDPFVHYLLHGRTEGRASLPSPPAPVKSAADIVVGSGLFDPEYYRTLYLDVALADDDPLEHYMSVGRLEQRRPSADFNPAVYLKSRPDVKKDGVDPLAHFIDRGRKEGRQEVCSGPGSRGVAESRQRIKDSGLFDADYYLRQCPVARDASVDPVLHYLVGGFAPFVHPSPAFTDSGYIEEGSATSKSDENPLLSYLNTKSLTTINPTRKRRRWRDQAIQHEIDAGKVYFDRFQLEQAAEHVTPAYLLDAIADLVCQKPSLAIERWHPDASIIIPIFGQLPYVLSCLDSLRRHQSRWSVEIIIADDASVNDPEIRFLEAIPWVRYVRREQNGGFIDNCNDAARIARGRFFVFLNSDTRVVDGWLDELADGFDLYPKAGLIGSSLCNSDGTLQEAGGIYWADGSAWNYGRGDDPLHPKYCFARQVDYVSGASIAVRAEAWHRVGGFDIAYRPAYCEDADLAFQLRGAGYEVWLQPLSRVVHFEGRSHGRDISGGVKRYQPLNMRKFAQRWQDTLADHGANGQNPDDAANRKARERVLVLDATTTTPDRDSGSFMALRMMILLQDLGYQITFVPEHNYAYDDIYTAALQRRGIQCLYRPHFRTIEDVLNFRSDFEVIVAYRHDVLGPLYTKLRDRMPTARLIFHNVDLHFLREERAAFLYGKRSKKIEAAITRATELELVAKVDCTIVHTADEADVIRKHLPVSNLIEFRYISELHSSNVSYEARFDIMFLGGFRHPPNVDAVKHFCSVIWPRLAERLPDSARFVIVGPDAPTEIRKLSGDRIVVTGYVPDLRPYFDSARVFVAPLRYGAGIKGKVIQSLSYGTPAVVSKIAAEGIGIASGRQAMVSEDDDAFLDEVARVYSDKVLWSSLQAEGYRFIEEQFSKKTGLQLMSKALDVADETWLRRHNRKLEKRLEGLLSDSPAHSVEAANEQQDLWVPAGHYYSPIVDPHDPNVDANLKRFGKAELPAQSGIVIDQVKMIALFEKLAEHYDLLRFPEKEDGSSIYYYENPFYSYGDAIVLALMMLSSKPEQIVEVGSGFSSAAMIEVNQKLMNGRVHLTFVEPFPDRLLRLLPSTSSYLQSVIRKPVQAVSPETFRQLKSGDILFIDSAHVSKMASDVNYLIFEILPILQAGVLIHIHDIFYPFDYPPEWIKTENRSWNEAYLVRAFLEFNPDFEIVFFNDYAYRKFPDLIQEHTPLFLKNSGGSLWIRRVHFTPRSELAAKRRVPNLASKS